MICILLSEMVQGLCKAWPRLVEISALDFGEVLAVRLLRLGLALRGGVCDTSLCPSSRSHFSTDRKSTKLNSFRQSFRSLVKR